MSSDTHKTRVNISLDPELYRRAKALGLNVSGVSERALRVYLDRLENGSAETSILLDSTNTNDSTETDDSNEQYADASTEDILDDYRQFATQSLTAVRTPSNSTPATSSDSPNTPVSRPHKSHRTTSRIISTLRVT